MLNIEKYKDEIQKRVDDGEDAKCVLDYIRTRKFYCSDCSSCGTCFVDSIKWYAEEYKPKIKMTKFEYDLIEACMKSRNYEPHDSFNSWNVLVNLQKIGYFKNVDSGMLLADILKNAEVEENE